MKLSRIRLLRIAAALGAIAIAAPAATAGAVTPVTIPAAGAGTTVIGPTFVTSAPATFINTNTQVSEGPSSAGNQVSP
jgi:hypothetical protein